MSRLSKNVVHNVVGQAAVLIVTFIAVKFILVRLGPDVFGVIFFVLTASPLIVAALDLGISATLVREVAAHAATDRRYVRELTQTASTVYWSFYVVATMVAVPLSVAAADHWLHLASLDASEAAWIIVIVGAGSLTALPRALYASVLRGLQHTGTVNAIDTGTAALQQAGAIILLLRGCGAIAVTLWLTGAYLIGTAAYVVACAGRLEWRAVVPGWSASVVRRTRRFTWHVFAISVLQTISQQVDRVVVSMLLAVGVFGAFTFMAAVALRGGILSLAVYLAALPALAALAAKGDRKTIRSQYSKLHDLQCYGTAVMMTVVPFAVLPAGRYLFGGAIASSLWLPVSLVALGVFMQMSTSIVAALALADGYPGVVAAAYAVGTSLAVPASFIAIKALGLAGAGLSAIVFNISVFSILVPAVSRRSLMVPTARWFWRLGRLGVIWSATFGLALWLLAITHHLQALPLSLGYATSFVAFAVLALKWGIGDDLSRSIVGSAPRVCRLLMDRRASGLP